MAKKAEAKKAKSIKVIALVDCYVNKVYVQRDQEVVISDVDFNEAVFKLAEGKPVKVVAEPPATGREAHKQEISREEADAESDEDKAESDAGEAQEGELLL